MLKADRKQTSPGERAKDLGERRCLRGSTHCDTGGAGVGVDERRSHGLPWRSGG